VHNETKHERRIKRSEVIENNFNNSQTDEAEKKGSVGLVENTMIIVIYTGRRFNRFNTHVIYTRAVHVFMFPFGSTISE